MEVETQQFKKTCEDRTWLPNVRAFETTVAEQVELCQLTHDMLHILLLNNKCHGLSPSGGHYSLFFDQTRCSPKTPNHSAI